MKKLIIIVIIILTVFNIILCLQVWKLKKHSNTNFADPVITDLRNTIWHNIINSDLSFDPDLLIRIENMDSIIRIRELIDKPRLFFYYNSSSCAPCTNTELNKLDSLSEIIGASNTLLLTKQTDYRSIYLLKRTNNYKFLIASFEELPAIPITQFPVSFYFVLDKEHYLKLFFVPLRVDQKLTDLYFERVTRFFTNK